MIIICLFKKTYKMEQFGGLFNEKWLLKDIKEYWYNPLAYVLNETYLYVEGYEQLDCKCGTFKKFILESRILIVKDQGIKFYTVIFEDVLKLELFKHYPHVNKLINVIGNLLYCQNKNQDILIINLKDDTEVIFKPDRPPDLTYITDTKIVLLKLFILLMEILCIAKNLMSDIKVISIRLIHIKG
jgi:hypothetical protein